jgi:hypothetical protein
MGDRLCQLSRFDRFYQIMYYVYFIVTTFKTLKPPRRMEIHFEEKLLWAKTRSAFTVDRYRIG